MNAPAALEANLINVARRPSQGGEYQTWFSREPSLPLGRFTVSGADAGTWAGDSGYAVGLEDDPRELVAQVEIACSPGGAVTLTITGTNVADAAIVGTAVIEFPDWSGLAQTDFPISYSVDVVPAVAGLFKTITTVAVDCLAAAAGMKIQIFGMPAQDSYLRIGCTEAKTYNSKSRVSRPIACEMDGSAFTAKGRSKPGELSITAKDSGTAGLGPFDGARVTVKFAVVHDGDVSVRNLYYTGYDVALEATAGDGETEATQMTKGNYETMMYMLPVSA